MIIIHLLVNISNDACQIDSIATGASVLVEGVVASSQGGKQKVELKVSKIIVVIHSAYIFPFLSLLQCIPPKPCQNSVFLSECRYVHGYKIE
jgi:hypothetical protein